MLRRYHDIGRPEHVLRKAVELIESGCIEEDGRKARRYVEKYTWDNIVGEFEEILRGLFSIDRIKRNCPKNKRSHS